MNAAGITLYTRDLAIGYGRKIVARDINITLQKGSVTAMLGENGVGKSTLIRTLMRELPPAKGSVSILGRDLKEYTPRQLAATVSLVSTDPIMAGALAVSELVALGRQPHTGFFGRLSAADREKVSQSLEAVGMSGMADRYVSSLSDGERQKALIARAIAQQTPIMVLDEPFSFLDVASRVEIMSMLKRVARNENTTVLLSSHDVAQALRMADDIILFTPESGVMQGNPREMIHTGLISRLFPDRNVTFDASQYDFIESDVNKKSGRSPQ